jgi:3-oxoacyl-[acyl-carrier protein] reductase
MPVSYDFRGRSAIVTGGAKGIGRAIAEQLIFAGALVSVWDIEHSDLSGASYQSVDVTNQGHIASGVEAALRMTGKIDILINNAGCAAGPRPVHLIGSNEWSKLLAVNLTSVFEVSRQVIPHMIRTGWGRIVNVASIAGKDGTPFTAPYSAAKAGVIALTKCMGKELADTGIRVNCVAPAAIDTEILGNFSAEAIEAMIAKSPLKRLGTVSEVADLVLWLSSEACSFSTGAVFDLSGGRATY